jgi:ABC-type multidrug transport system ATPase subunit
MDEPTAGMAPAERVALMALTRRLVTEQGVSVLFTEHSMDVVFSFADRVIVLARGALIAQGSVADVRDDARVREAYFGSGRFDAARYSPRAVESRQPLAGDAASPRQRCRGDPERPA